MDSKEDNLQKTQETDKKVQMLVQKVTSDEIVAKVALIAMKKLEVIEERLLNIEIVLIALDKKSFTDEDRACLDAITAHVQTIKDTLHEVG